MDAGSDRPIFKKSTAGSLFCPLFLLPFLLSTNEHDNACSLFCLVKSVSFFFFLAFHVCFPYFCCTPTEAKVSTTALSSSMLNELHIIYIEIFTAVKAAIILIVCKSFPSIFSGKSKV